MCKVGSKEGGNVDGLLYDLFQWKTYVETTSMGHHVLSRLGSTRLDSARLDSKDRDKRTIRRLFSICQTPSIFLALLDQKEFRLEETSKQVGYKASNSHVPSFSYYKEEKEPSVT